MIPICLLTAAALLQGGDAPNSSPAPALTAVAPVSSLAAPVDALVTGATPGSRVQISASLLDDRGIQWTATAQFIADPRGEVDTRRMAAVSGTYTGVLSGGLMCSVLPFPPQRANVLLEEVARTRSGTLPAIGGNDSYAVQLTAVVSGREIGTTSAVRFVQSPAVRREAVTAGRLRGVYFRPQSLAKDSQGRRQDKPKIPVLVIGGSGGGVPQAQAALLANAGHPALALAYFAYEDLPANLLEIPIEYFAEGVAWLKSAAESRHIAVVGASRGSEAAQLLAVHHPQGIAGLVLLVPSAVPNPGHSPQPGEGRAAWSVDAEPVAFPPASPEILRGLNGELIDASTQPPAASPAPYFAALWSGPAARDYVIPLERTRAKVLLLSGGVDTMWPSSMGAEQIAARLTQFGRARSVQSIVYPAAGHLISRPGIGNAISSFLFHPQLGHYVTAGGVPEENCAASYAAWAQIERFLADLQ